MAAGAGKLVAGEPLFDKIRKNKVKIVFTVSDMGASQFKKINDKCNFYKVPIYNGLFSAKELNQALGRENTKAIGIVDDNFKKLVEKKLSKGDVEYGG